MFATYLACSLGLITSAALFGLCAVWPPCRAAARANRLMDIKDRYRVKIEKDPT